MELILKIYTDYNCSVITGGKPYLYLLGKFTGKRPAISKEVISFLEDLKFHTVQDRYAGRHENMLRAGILEVIKQLKEHKKSFRIQLESMYISYEFMEYHIEKECK